MSWSGERERGSQVLTDLGDLAKFGVAKVVIQEHVTILENFKVDMSRARDKCMHGELIDRSRESMQDQSYISDQMYALYVHMLCA